MELSCQMLVPLEVGWAWASCEGWVNSDGSCDHTPMTEPRVGTKREKGLRTPSKGWVSLRLFYLRLTVGRAVFTSFPGERQFDRLRDWGRENGTPSLTA